MENCHINPPEQCFEYPEPCDCNAPDACNCQQTATDLFDAHECPLHNRVDPTCRLVIKEEECSF